MNLKEFIRQKARDLGFSAAGIASADYDPAGHDRLLRWLDNEYQAGMRYMERSPRRRYDSRSHLADARSIIVCAQNYYSEPLGDGSGGYISIYARGENYHTVMADKMGELCRGIDDHFGKFERIIMVDSSPIGEKALAVRAGIGFIGRNGMIIIPKSGPGHYPKGSFHFLGIIVTDLEIEPDDPAEGTCGKCRRCIDACPTGAIVGDGVIDSNRCISYHTTQNKGEVPEDIAEKTNNMIFGCDICQTVCPYNAHPVTTSEARLLPRPDLIDIDLDEMNRLDERQFGERFQGTAIEDIKFEMFKKILGIAVANKAADLRRDN